MTVQRFIAMSCTVPEMPLDGAFQSDMLVYEASPTGDGSLRSGAARGLITGQCTASTSATLLCDSRFRLSTFRMCSKAKW